MWTFALSVFSGSCAARVSELIWSAMLWHDKASEKSDWSFIICSPYRIMLRLNNKDYPKNGRYSRLLYSAKFVTLPVFFCCIATHLQELIDWRKYTKKQWTSPTVESSGCTGGLMRQPWDFHWRLYKSSIKRLIFITIMLML